MCKGQSADKNTVSDDAANIEKAREVLSNDIQREEGKEEFEHFRKVRAIAWSIGININDYPKLMSTDSFEMTEERFQEIKDAEVIKKKIDFSMSELIQMDVIYHFLLLPSIKKDYANEDDIMLNLDFFDWDLKKQVLELKQQDEYKDKHVTEIVLEQAIISIDDELNAKYGDAMNTENKINFVI